LKVSLDDASIEPTAYVRQDNQRIYGFAFASDSNSATTESLYACTDDATHPQGVMGRGLAKLSVPAFTTSPIADYTNGLAGRPCMPTGNAAGELFGMFYFGTSGAPLELAQIDPATAATPTITQLPISLLANHDGSIPFVFWGGDFWFFVPDNSVVRYHYSTDKSFEMVLAPDRSKPIVTGAAVSTCAPVFL
jgi:hypothetical protein